MFAAIFVCYGSFSFPDSLTHVQRSSKRWMRRDGSPILAFIFSFIFSIWVITVNQKEEENKASYPRLFTLLLTEKRITLSPSPLPILSTAFSALLPNYKLNALKRQWLYDWADRLLSFPKIPSGTAWLLQRLSLEEAIYLRRAIFFRFCWLFFEVRIPRKRI